MNHKLNSNGELHSLRLAFPLYMKVSTFLKSFTRLLLRHLPTQVLWTRCFFLSRSSSCSLFQVQFQSSRSGAWIKNGMTFLVLFLSTVIPACTTKPCSWLWVERKYMFRQREALPKALPTCRGTKFEPFHFLLSSCSVPYIAKDIPQ